MKRLIQQLGEIVPYAMEGRVASVVGLTLSAVGLPAPLGAECCVDRQIGPPLLAEIVGFRENVALLLAHGDVRGVRPGDRVRLVRSLPNVQLGPGILGRLVDAFGRVADGAADFPRPWSAPLFRKPPAPMDRPRIAEPFATSIRAIDSLLTLGVGQRMGIFAGTGVGKSVLLGMIAGHSRADINVIALIGERGREVREFIDRDLKDGLGKSVVVMATADEPALARVRAAFTATAIAEFFRDLGHNVLLMMDSVTRLAMAQREIGLSAGEPPTTKGYPPSVFAMLPPLLERAGRSPDGSITGLYTVLVEAEDTNEIVADTLRGILDGHLWLSRKLAGQAHYPAIDMLDSISRSMPDIVSAEHLRHAHQIRQWLATYADNQDLISVGAYQKGANPLLDKAIAARDRIHAFLRQAPTEHAEFAETLKTLATLASL